MLQHIFFIGEMHKVNNIFAGEVAVAVSGKDTGWYDANLFFSEETSLQ